MKKFIPSMVLSALIMAGCNQDATEGEKETVVEPSIDQQINSTIDKVNNETEPTEDITQRETESSDEHQQNDSENLDTESVTTTDETEGETQEEIYKNESYSFSLTFPETWKGYTVANLDNGIKFGLKGQDDIFAMSAFTKEEWDKMKLEDPDFAFFEARYVGENDKYVFTGSGSSEYVSDELTKRRNEVNSILKTFKAI